MSGNTQNLFCYFRGMVVDVLQDMGEVSIKCLDYGNIITVNFRMVHCLMPCFQKMPALAMEAELAGIQLNAVLAHEFQFYLFHLEI